MRGITTTLILPLEREGTPGNARYTIPQMRSAHDSCNDVCLPVKRPTYGDGIENSNSSTVIGFLSLGQAHDTPTCF